VRFSCHTYLNGELRMKWLKRLKSFLIGPSPAIFDKQGRVVHDFPPEYWEKWHNYTKSRPQYNWRNHAGTVAQRKRF
jgi:hypothetical protein